MEYSLTLNTGEKIHICELDRGRVGPLDAPTAAPFIERCSKVPRAALEEAKRGYTKPLERLLRTPPVGALLKVSSPICSEKSNCIMADEFKCSLRNISKSGGKFPICWSAGEELATHIAHAWRQGVYVIIVE